MRIVIWIALFGCSAAPQPVHNAVPRAPAEVAVDDDWEPRCRESLAAAETAFRRDAPRIYPDYASLAWTADPADGDADPGGRIVQVQITPGRTWKLQAAALTDESLGWAFPDLHIDGDAWHQLADYDAAYGRRVGRMTLAIVIETERSAVPVAQHPLVVEFVKRMKTALDRCP